MGLQKHGVITAATDGRVSAVQGKGVWPNLPSPDTQPQKTASAVPQPRGKAGQDCEVNVQASFTHEKDGKAALCKVTVWGKKDSLFDTNLSFSYVKIKDIFLYFLLIWELDWGESEVIVGKCAHNINISVKKQIK